VPEIRVIDPNGDQMGIMKTGDALRRSNDYGLDLVEVSPTAEPPFCRIMDFGKYRYEQSKKQAEAKKKQTVVETKEIKLRPKTDVHDLNFKVQNIRKFLGQGNKVKVTLRFRGREIVYAGTLGMDVLKKIGDSLADVADIIQRPSMEGRQMAMFLAPKKNQ